MTGEHAVDLLVVDAGHDAATVGAVAEREAVALADTVAGVMARETQLPPYQYPTTNVTTKVGTSGYVYARNLLAIRLYRCPVLYCEPYVMNSHQAFARIQAGDYEGTRNIEGVERKSIFREYADSVTDGLIEYYSKARGKCN